MNKAARLLAASATLAVVAAFPSFAQTGIQVVMNQARIIKLARPAETVVVGNSDIADAAVGDSSTIILTGKGFGVTNIVALDETGAPIVDAQVTVVRDSQQTVRIYRRADIQTLSCTPYCEGAYKSAAEQASEAAISTSD